MALAGPWVWLRSDPRAGDGGVRGWLFERVAGVTSAARARGCQLKWEGPREATDPSANLRERRQPHVARVLVFENVGCRSRLEASLVCPTRSRQARVTGGSSSTPGRGIFDEKSRCKSSERVCDGLASSGPTRTKAVSPRFPRGLARLQASWAESDVPPNPRGAGAARAVQVNDRRSCWLFAKRALSAAAEWLEPRRRCPDSDRGRQTLGDAIKALPT